MPYDLVLQFGQHAVHGSIHIAGSHFAANDAAGIGDRNLNDVAVALYRQGNMCFGVLGEILVKLGYLFGYEIREVFLSLIHISIAQSIVDITMSVLHVNVNIMDVNGTVIAAGDKSRIGTFHCAAAEVIATGQKKAVSAQEAATMDNVEPGATYPIVYKGEVIGALGMTGAPEYVDKFVELGALYRCV